MLVGPAGCGKTLLMNNKLSNLPEDEYGVTNMCFNYYTTSGKPFEIRPVSFSKRSHYTLLYFHRASAKSFGKTTGEEGWKKLWSSRK